MRVPHSTKKERWPKKPGSWKCDFCKCLEPPALLTRVPGTAGSLCTRKRREAMAQKYGDYDSQGRALIEENQADSINLLYLLKQNRECISDRG